MKKNNKNCPFCEGTGSISLDLAMDLCFIFGYLFNADEKKIKLISRPAKVIEKIYSKLVKVKLENE